MILVDMDLRFVERKQETDTELGRVVKKTRILQSRKLVKRYEHDSAKWTSWEDVKLSEEIE